MSRHLAWLAIALLSALGCEEQLPPEPGTPPDASPKALPPAPPPPAPTAPASATCQQALDALKTTPFPGLIYVGTETAPEVVAFATDRQAPAQLTALPGPELLSVVRRLASQHEASPLSITAPLNEAVFPPDGVAPTLTWQDQAQADHYLVHLTLGHGVGHLYQLARSAPPPRRPIDERANTPPEVLAPTALEQSARGLRPEEGLWALVRACAVDAPATLEVTGFRAAEPAQAVSYGALTLSVSSDPVEAPIFFRDVPLPFKYALKNLKLIRWRMGAISTREPPKTLLEDMPVCANCHSFSADGKTLAMDVDYANDKGSYVVADIQPTTELTKDKTITWSQFSPGDPEPTFGLLSQISPDGRYVLSTVKDVSVFLAVPDLEYSQLFFPIRGIVAVYDRQEKRFFALPGADNPAFVQSNPTWSPDGQTILFARADAVPLKTQRATTAVINQDNLSTMLQYDRFTFKPEGGTKYRYDLYRVPFNGGKGGQATPLPGASGNNRSNFFPRFSPDGRWIVFCQADSYMLLRPDSELYIMPAEGGTPRKLKANHDGKMNSWHSFSPNGRWLVFSSKRNTPFTQLWLTHIDAQGNDSVPVVLEQFTELNRAANIPEFVNTKPEAFTHIKDATADYYGYYRQGTQFLVLNDYDLAAEQFKTATELKPDDADSHAKLGRALILAGKAGEAVAALERAAGLMPADLDIQAALANALAAAGSLPRALEIAAKVVEGRPRDPAALAALAELQLQADRPKEALATLRRAGKPTTPEQVLRLAEILVAADEGAEARALLQAAQAEAPTHPALSARLAQRLATETPLDQAKLDALLAVACPAGACATPEALEAKGASLAAAGRFPEAAEALRLALSGELPARRKAELTRQRDAYLAGRLPAPR